MHHGDPRPPRLGTAGDQLVPTALGGRCQRGHMREIEKVVLCAIGVMVPL
jgi:hypothetical protein